MGSAMFQTLGLVCGLFAATTSYAYCCCPSRGVCYCVEAQRRREDFDHPRPCLWPQSGGHQDVELHLLVCVRARLGGHGLVDALFHFCTESFSSRLSFVFDWRSELEDTLQFYDGTWVGHVSSLACHDYCRYDSDEVSILRASRPLLAEVPGCEDAPWSSSSRHGLLHAAGADVSSSPTPSSPHGFVYAKRSS